MRLLQITGQENRLRRNRQVLHSDGERLTGGNPRLQREFAGTPFESNFKNRNIREVDSLGRFNLFPCALI